MNDEQNTSDLPDPPDLPRAYRRAGIGLAAAAVLWIVAILISSRLEEGNTRWLVPIGAALLSVFFFSLYREAKDSEE